MLDSWNWTAAFLSHNDTCSLVQNLGSDWLEERRFDWLGRRGFGWLKEREFDWLGGRGSDWLGERGFDRLEEREFDWLGRENLICSKREDLIGWGRGLGERVRGERI